MGISAFQSASTNRRARGWVAARLATALVATSAVEWFASSWTEPSSVQRFPYESIPFDSKNAWIRSLNSRSRGSAAHHDQSTDQFAAVRQASGPKVPDRWLKLAVTGVPSKFAYSGASPVAGCVAFWKKSRLTRAASAQNGRSASGPHRAHSS